MKILLKILPVIGLIVTASCTKTTITVPSSEAIQQEISTEQIAAGISLGQEYGGGIVFYLDSTRQHGLIAAKSDADTVVAWYNTVYYQTNARAAAIGSGARNTRKIIDALGNSGTYAAKVCQDYRGGGYSDWFLPSKNELNLLYKRKAVVGNLISGYYWSSTESDFKYAWSQYFGFGYQGLNDKKFAFFVRPVRAF
jgi:hypothetical protein